MSRSLVWMLGIVISFAALSCSSGNSEAPADSPTSTSSTSATPASPEPTVSGAALSETDYHAPLDCFSLSFPGDWQIALSGKSASAFASDYCPGGTQTGSSVATCGADAVDQGVLIFHLNSSLKAPNDQPAGSLFVYASSLRCATLQAHFDQILAGLTASEVIAGAHDETIAGYPARCAQLRTPFKSRDVLQKFCAVEVDSAIYHVIENVDELLQDSIRPALDGTLDSLHLRPLHTTDHNITITDNKFDTDRIVVVPGTAVTIRLTNTGVAIHDFHVGGADGQFSSDFCEPSGSDPCSGRLQGDGQGGSLKFEAPAVEGELSFRCDFHPSEMHGTIAVQNGAP